MPGAEWDVQCNVCNMCCAVLAWLGSSNNSGGPAPYPLLILPLLLVIMIHSSSFCFFLPFSSSAVCGLCNHAVCCLPGGVCVLRRFSSPAIVVANPPCLHRHHGSSWGILVHAQWTGCHSSECWQFREELMYTCIYIMSLCNYSLSLQVYCSCSLSQVSVCMHVFVFSLMLQSFIFVYNKFFFLKGGTLGMTTIVSVRLWQLYN